MDPDLLCLFCLGLCCIYVIRAQSASPPRPSLYVQPGPVVRPGEEVTFLCRRPSYDWLATFILLKAGTHGPLRKKELPFSQANFSLKSLRAQDSGNYSCIYYKTTYPYVLSELSETLELWVTDRLPKPSLSARPSSRVTSGDNVTLLCQGPSRGVKFALYKDGEETPVSTREPTRHGAEFPLINVNINQTGKYRCCYLLGRESPVLAPPSDPLELIIQEEQNQSLLTRDSTQSVYFVNNLFHISLAGLVLFVIGILLASDWNSLRS